MKKLSRKNETDKVTEAAETTETTERKPAKRKGKKRYIVIGAAALVVIIGAVSAGGDKGEGATETATPSEAVSEVSEPRYEAELDSLLAPTKINGDKTGNWYWTGTTKTTPPDEYAPEYYERYMNEGELHYIWNVSLKTVTAINDGGDGWLYIRVTEYAEDEERSADTIGTGMPLLESRVNIETGEVEQLQ